MNHQKYPLVTIIISLVTLIYSLYVNYEISGSLLGKIKITQLEQYGGITFEHLWNLELWRLFVSQVVHVKQLHMFFNVASFLLLGIILEGYIGAIRFFLLWFISGAVGTLISTLTVEPPWNLGTGASQAILGVAALGVLLLYKKIDTSLFLKFAVIFAILPALLLDLIFVHYPKLGHVTGFMVGWIIAFYYSHRDESLKIVCEKNI
ncbi:rhomboid family intramembrane serine protease [Zooshikella ganghwensis]|uniref:Rhomboid family intramembrane serine protease n=1 Tax=Zooshikella ganghwensis TaxID=202772 RepID=A0A4P9VJC9_9GAMM|nr:rhomboid family intramembrane serine protease [Zooshikella ganghwensis]RDH42599.1 rhomboid family intramembrane serine protease [Zooshikella ganghwensis]